MNVNNELEIYGNISELIFFYNNFNFKNIYKPPSYLIDYYELKEWCYKNWGTDKEMKLLHKILVNDNLEQKVSFSFQTNYPPLKIIDYFSKKNPHLTINLYYDDYYDYINALFEWNNGIMENHYYQDL
jgi:hypothetical protein